MFGAMAVAHPAGAADVSNYQVVFETVCIGSSLDKTKIEPLVKFVADRLKGSILAMSEQEVALSGPDNKEGWTVKVGPKAIIITRGEKRLGSFESSSCTVSIRQDDSAEIIRFVETLYRTKKMVDEVQGLSQFRLYTADLIGLNGKYAIGVQSGHGIVSLSLFALP